MYLEAGYAPARETNRLPRYLGFAYFLLTAYACLTPFDDFHSIAGSPLEFLIQGWPRYFIPLDAALNVLGFVPLGFLVAAAQRGKTPPRQALIRAALLCTAFSFSLEFCQNYLAERVASNLDLACNALGGLFGAAAGARWRHVMVPGGWVHAWRHRRLPAGRRGEIGPEFAAVGFETVAEEVGKADFQRRTLRQGAQGGVLGHVDMLLFPALNSLKGTPMMWAYSGGNLPVLGSM